MTASVFWGKYVEETGARLPLAAHCLDVGLVFRRLCEVDNVRRSLQETTSVELTAVILDRLAVLAMLHDVGKVNSGFQKQILPNNPPVGHVRELAAVVSEPDLLQRFFAVLPQELKTGFRKIPTPRKVTYWQRSPTTGSR